VEANKIEQGDSRNDPG